ncbi:MAG TPA: hypothetical protein VLE53_01610 [Gemmatimonadaceae bacterium]|nr:hypothetical protein [Gemmatimonadaceae bacterium]
MRTTRLHLSAGFVLTAFALTACGPRDDTGAAVDSPAAATTPTTTTPSSAVTSIDIGKSIGTDKRVTDATTMFSPRDTMYVSVTTQNAPANAMLTAKLTFQDGQVVDSLSQAVAAATATGGPTITEFHLARPSGWPAGRYTVEVMLNGQSVGTREITVNQ